MKRLARITVLLATAFLAGPVMAKDNVCLRTTAIDRTHVVDARTIDFRMKDGTVWRNNLPSKCSTVALYGFVYSVNYNQICGSQQSIRVLQSNEICSLGPFTKLGQN